MDNRVVVALDPGETTGYCVFALERLVEVSRATSVYEVFELLTRVFATYWSEKISVFSVVYVVEGFDGVGPAVGSHVQTIKIIGVVELLARVYDARIVWHTPHQRREFLPRVSDFASQFPKLS